MLELYLDEKFHLSSEIEVLEVENVGFSSDSLCKLHREFGLKIIQNHGKSKVFQLPRLLSPSWSGIFEWNKFLTCEVMSQKAQKWGLERMWYQYQQEIPNMKKFFFYT